MGMNFPLQMNLKQSGLIGERRDFDEVFEKMVV
jgi:hypothetical protein